MKFYELEHNFIDRQIECENRRYQQELERLRQQGELLKNAHLERLQNLKDKKKRYS